MVFKRILKASLWLVFLLLLFLLSMNILVPVYVFDEPEPFHGDYLRIKVLTQPIGRFATFTGIPANIVELLTEG